MKWADNYFGEGMAEDQAEIEEEILNVCAIFPDVVSRIGDRVRF